MIEVLATNITSPLGFSTEENYRAVRAGSSALACYEGWRDIPERFAASIFSEEQIAKIGIEGCSRFESLVIYSIKEALNHCKVDIASPRTLLVLSTTKANIDELRLEGESRYLAPGATAKKIALHLGMASEPVVVCNACISGVTAQVVAERLISEGMYDTVVVCGADIVSPFVAAGFLSFKSLSPEPCRPFDIERLGLNLGEAGSTIIFGRAEGKNERWKLLRSDLNNDAYHVSAPSPVGEGSVEAIDRVLQGVDIEDIGTVCVHGTATMFNDQMESKAIARTGLSQVPISALKGYYGHTLGAAGVLETVLTMRALDDGIVLAVRGYEEIGVGGKINISNEERTCSKSRFLKIISGFGGCNGALLYDKNSDLDALKSKEREVVCSHSIRIDNEGATLDGTPLSTTAKGEALLKELYKNHIGDYAKFYKMDTLSRLALVATDLLLSHESDEERGEVHDIVLFNRTSSIVADRLHLATIADKESFYPSPSVFLYTLPNIATGEIAIKHSFRGETSLYILNEKSEALIEQIISTTLANNNNKHIITGWIDCESKDRFEAEIKILTKK